MTTNFDPGNFKLLKVYHLKFGNLEIFHDLHNLILLTAIRETLIRSVDRPNADKCDCSWRQNLILAPLQMCYCLLDSKSYT